MRIQPPSSDKKRKEDPRPSIQFWVDKIKAEGLSAFASTAQQISEFEDDDQANLARISKLIMSDAGMTTKVLTVSNSSLRLRRGKVNTVSRALVILGMAEVKKICLSCALIDGLLQGSPSEGLLDEMSRALHAATHSRLLALQRGDSSTEEVFLFSLVSGIGALGFWKVGGQTAEKLKEAILTSDKKPEEVEFDILGFTLADLSKALISEWKLESYNPLENSKDLIEARRAKEVGYTSKLSKYIAKGWNDLNVKNLLKEMAKALSLQDSVLQATIVSAVRDTEDTFKTFGLPKAVNPIPLPPENVFVHKVSEEINEQPFIACDPDPILQLKILRELNTLAMDGGEVTIAIFRILDGMYKGMGMDRAVFAILNDARDSLQARLVNGAKRSWTLENFNFPLVPQVSDIFSHAAKNKKTIWYSKNKEEVMPLITPLMSSVLCSEDFFLAPLIVSGKWIAVFYADRQESGRVLDQSDFESFKQFVFQGSIVLTQHGDKF